MYSLQKVGLNLTSPNGIGMNIPAQVQRAPVIVEDQEVQLAILELAKNGDESACRQLFGIYHRRVFAFLWRMLGRQATTALVEDLVQESFIRVFEALPRFAPDGPARLSSWIITIAYRLALHELSKQKVRKKYAVEQRLASVPPEELGDRTELSKHLEEALGKLSEKHRAVFLLYEYQDMNYEQIAQSLHMGVGTVKSRLFRARAQLRESLKEFVHE